MNIRFASKVIIFQDTLQHDDVINFCYVRQIFLELQGYMLDDMGSLQNNLWNDAPYCETMYPPLNPRLLDILGCLKCYIFNKCVYAKWNLTIWNQLHQLCEGGFWVWIACNMHVNDGEILAILVPFLAFSFTYNVNKAHKILALMLDPCFKSFDVLKTFVIMEKMI